VDARSEVIGDPLRLVLSLAAHELEPMVVIVEANDPPKNA